MREILLTSPVLADETYSLVEQADGLARAEAMKRVIGPALTDMLQLTYTEPLTAEERQKISDIWRYPNAEGLARFSGCAKQILDARFAGQHATPQSEMFQRLSKLIGARPDLLFFDWPEQVVHEGLNSGVVAPMMVAQHIYRLEEEQDYPSKGVFNPDALAAIMTRPSFDQILLRLTKGPNGFLGQQSTQSKHFFSEKFFDFYRVEADGSVNEDERMRVTDAYAMESGRVVGLSPAYAISAHDRRERQREHYSGLRSKHDFVNSSGCPVRHGFEIETSTAQEPLIVTAKNFLINALQIAVQQKAAHAEAA
jgi:hypothetical protein